MPPVVIDVRAADDLRDVVHRAVQAVTEGQLVVFPTETVYGVAARALDGRAVERLVRLKDRREGHPLTLAIRGTDEAVDYVPDLSPLAERFARRCWPGPVTLVVDNSHPDSLVQQLPESVQQAVSPTGRVGLRVPGDEIILATLRMVAGPLVLTSANRAGQPEATTAGGAVEALGDGVDLVLDDGPSRFGQASSVVSVRGSRYEVLRAGVVPEQTLARLSARLILFVCTGNTCRSPMAETLCRAMLADRLGCKSDDLEDRGIIVASAGMAAIRGGRASENSAAVMARMGLDLSRHETQPLTDTLVRDADAIYTMTRAHRQGITMQWPGSFQRTHLLCLDGSDISDPIGGPVERYQACAAQMQRELKNRLDELALGNENN
jgi:protein-tyrosine phosphatase